jgi:hypothetical protein
MRRATSPSRVIPFTPRHQPRAVVDARHALRRQWKTLTADQQAAVVALVGRFSALNAAALESTGAERRAIQG